MSARFQLALERVSSSDWKRFEDFASSFLVSEFPDLRTTATPSGDGGRDAELYQPESDPTNVLQYSVTADYKSKLWNTARKVAANFPNATLITYVTNQQIGAAADDVKKAIRSELRLHIDVRDRSYFTDRENASEGTRLSSEELARDFVDPLLSSREIIGTTSILTRDEVKAAHVFLSLQLRDDTQDRGLTKTAFDALVRSVLVGTSSERRLSGDQITQRVASMLPGNSTERISQLTESALNRLYKKKNLGRYPNDEYCLSFMETRAQAEHLAAQALAEEQLRHAIEKIIRSVDDISDTKVEPIGIRVRRLLESALYARAESFAEAIANGKVNGFVLDSLFEQVSADLKAHPVYLRSDPEANPELLRGIVGLLLCSPDEVIQQHLHYLSDAYTLLAFLKSTPDIQSAMEKVFSHGEVWLDTTLLLPLLAEELLTGDSGKLQQIVSLASAAGLEFYTTRGVIEELSTHLNRALAFGRTPSSRWEGGIPFIYQMFVQAGRAENDFESWVEEFRGASRPEEDLIAYLEMRFRIKLKNLDTELAETDPDLRYAVDEYWIGVHEKRRERSAKSERALDPITINRLAKHDTESYLGVVHRRDKDGNSPLGYSAWWLTFDRFALGVEQALRKSYAGPSVQSPVMSLDFLNQYLSLGPNRSKLPKGSVQALPILIEPRMMAFLSKDLIEEAKKIRSAMQGATEWKIQRQVRDRLNDERRKRGQFAEAGIQTFIDEIGDAGPVLYDEL